MKSETEIQERIVELDERYRKFSERSRRSVDPTAAWGRRARPTPLPDKPCQICREPFPPGMDRHINCSPRCAYISRMLDRDAAKLMSRDAAIEHYGQQYDVPFRSLGRSIYRPLVLAIAEYCDVHDTTTFTCKQIAGECGFKFYAPTLAGCARNVAAVWKTGNRVNIGTGKSVIEWEFGRELL